MDSTPTIADKQAIDDEALREIINEIVPYQRASGVLVTDLGSKRAATEVSVGPDGRNHVGTAHAALLFLTAEAAAGAAFAAHLGEELPDVTFVVKEASIRYQKAANGRVRGRCEISPDVERDLAMARADGRGTVTVDARALDDDDRVVAGAAFTYHVRFNRHDATQAGG